MAALHTHEFFSGRISVVSVANLYTVPAGKLIVVRAISFQNASGASHQAGVTVDSGWIVAAPVLTAVGTVGSNFQWKGWVALQAGRVLNYFGVAGVPIDLNISGYLYFV